MLEDQRLIWRFNRGDKDALRRIYEKYKADLVKTAAALLNDRSAMEDVLHDVFVSFAQTAGTFTLRGNLKGYLAICVANRARDRNRAHRRQPAVGLDSTESLPSRTRGPVQSAIARESARLLDEAMARLPSEQKEVLILHLHAKLKFRQIAKSLGVSVNTIQSRYRYGLDKLRRILNENRNHESVKHKNLDPNIVS